MKLVHLVAIFLTTLLYISCEEWFPTQNPEIPGITGSFVFMNSDDFSPITNVSVDGIDTNGYHFQKTITLESNQIVIECPEGEANITMQFISFQNGEPPDHWSWGFINDHLDDNGPNTIRFENLKISGVTVIGDILVYASAIYHTPTNDPAGLAQNRGIIISASGISYTDIKENADFYIDQHYFSSANHNHQVSSVNGIIDITEMGTQITDSFQNDDLFLDTPPNDGYISTIIYTTFEEIAAHPEWIVRLPQNQHAKIVMSGYAYQAVSFGYTIHLIWGIDRFLWPNEGI